MFSIHAVGNSMNQDLFNKVAESVVGFMFDRRMIETPFLLNLRNDHGLFLFLFDSMNRNLNSPRTKDIPAYILFQAAGMQSFAAGVYVTGKQADFNHPVDAFTDDEVQRITDDFYDNDIYELGLNTLGIQKGSSHDEILNMLIITAFQTAEAEVGSDVFKEQNFKACMKVLFNAGVTLLMN